VEMRVDCDRDAILMKVRQTGPACHTGARSCFFTKVSYQRHEALAREGDTRRA
jgi:phosphoribosyl-AMP cyclohydrolase